MRFFLAAQMNPAARRPACGFSLDGMEFRVRPTDYYAFQEIVVEGEYDFIKPILDAAGPAPLVADIGANIGLFAIRALSHSSRCRVHSFEPIAETFGILDANRRLNPSRPWEVHMIAAWSSNGEVEFQTGDFSTGARAAARSGGEIVPTADLRPSCATSSDPPKWT